jgi:hypothetical protein
MPMVLLCHASAIQSHQKKEHMTRMRRPLFGVVIVIDCSCSAHQPSLVVDQTALSRVPSPPLITQGWSISLSCPWAREWGPTPLWSGMQYWLLALALALALARLVKTVAAPVLAAVTKNSLLVAVPLLLPAPSMQGAAAAPAPGT